MKPTVDQYENQELESRMVLSCDNLLENGDFETYVPHNDCVILEFQNGWVPPWVDFGTSDLWSIEGSTVCTWDCVRYAHATSIGKNEITTGIVGVEGLQQAVSIVSDPDIYYSLSLEATPTLGETAIFNAYFLQGAPLFDPMEAPDLSNGFQIIQQAISGPGCGVMHWPVIEQDNIYPDQDYDNFFVFAQSNDGNAFLLQDNYELLCHSRLLNGIRSETLADCQYVFEADFLGPLEVLQYEWDFGDGSTSTAAQPIHTFAPGGLYVVTLTVKDANGCCTTVRTVIACSSNIPSCTSYACWDELGHVNGGLECMVGLRLRFPDCSIQDLAFQSIPNAQECNDGISPSQIPVPAPLPENYCEIKQLIGHALDAAGLNYVILEENDGLEDCFKVFPQFQIPGYFVTVEGAEVVGLLAADCTLGQVMLNDFRFDDMGSGSKNCFGCP